MLNNRVVVQIGTYNANLQAHGGLPQNLVDWLAPSLKVSSFLSKERTAPDLVAIGFQELLPLQLGFAGLSKPVMESRDKLIRSQLEEHAPQKEKYVLIAKAVNVGIALLVYARDDTVAKHVSDVQTQWTGCGPGWMGNKGAVGVRFRVSNRLYDSQGSQDSSPDAGEVYTFVNSHLTAHQPNLEERVSDYRHIVQTLLFPPPSSASQLGKIAGSDEHSNMYHTTHLFFFGDLNFRINPLHGTTRDHLERLIRTEEGREELKSRDQLTIVREEGRALTGLREGEFWKFQCTYKYQLGEVDLYHPKRIPSWTDRILFTTVGDHPSDLSKSLITPLVYTPIPSYTTSDHKPVMALLQLPPRPSTNLGNSALNTGSSTPSSVSAPAHDAPLLPYPVQYSNDPAWVLKRYIGKVLGWCIGWPWCLFWFIGAGNAVVGLVGSVLGMLGVVWWKNPNRLEG